MGLTLSSGRHLARSGDRCRQLETRLGGGNGRDASEVEAGGAGHRTAPQGPKCPRATSENHGELSSPWWGEPVLLPHKAVTYKCGSFVQLKQNVEQIVNKLLIKVFIC